MVFAAGACIKASAVSKPVGRVLSACRDVHMGKELQPQDASRDICVAHAPS